MDSALAARSFQVSPPVMCLAIASVAGLWGGGEITIEIA